MRKTLCSVGLAGILLGGCTPSGSTASPTPATTTSRVEVLPHDVASVDLMEPAVRDPIDAQQARRAEKGSHLPDEVSLNRAKTGLPDKAPQARAGDGLSVEAEVASRAQQGHEAERELAALAQSRSDNRQVKALAELIASDHRLAEEKLRRATLTRLPEKPQLPVAEQALKKELVKLDGKAFDRAYVDGMVKGHSQTLAMYTEQSRKAPTEALRAYFKETRPVIEKHLRRLESLRASLPD